MLYVDDAVSVFVGLCSVCAGLLLRGCRCRGFIHYYLLSDCGLRFERVGPTHRPDLDDILASARQSSSDGVAVDLREGIVMQWW